jgi:hypothetical protein
MKDRTEADCRLLTAAICTDMQEGGIAMLIGALCAAYKEHPDAEFWNVVEDVLGYKKKPPAWDYERRVVQARSQFTPDDPRYDRSY